MTEAEKEPDFGEDYVDTFVIDFRPAIDQMTIDDSETLIFDLGSGEWDDRVVRAAVREALRDAGQTDGVILTMRRTQYSWGADGAGAELLVEFAKLIASVGVEALFVHVARVAKRRLLGGAEPEAMPEDEAVRWAKQRVSLRYEVEVDDLRLTAVGREGAAAKVVLEDAVGRQYDLTISGFGASAYLGSIVAREPGSAA